MDSRSAVPAKPSVFRFGAWSLPILVSELVCHETSLVNIGLPGGSFPYHHSSAPGLRSASRVSISEAIVTVAGSRSIIGIYIKEIHAK